jgi:membrane fusion protein (multidrug efflux system)
MYRKNEWDSGPASRQSVPARAPKSEEIIDVEPVSPAPPHAEAKAPAPALLAPAKIAAAAPVAEAGSRRFSGRQLAVGALLAAGLGAGAWFGYDWWTVGRFTVSTDDAYVEAHNTTLAAKVSGYLASVLVDDNSHVRAGDVIATIDDGDYRLAADSAREKAATQEATIERIGHQIDAQQGAVTQAKAQLDSANAAATRMELELTRQTTLAAKDFATKQALEQAQANRDQAVAAVQGAQAALDSAAANVDVLKGQQQEAIRTLAELKTSLAKAERDLSFTVIRAPIDGVIGNRAVQTGDYVQPGQRLASVVPLGEVYVDANFKETQLAELRPGQPVSVAVDALPEHAIQATVESISPASGSVFSLLPPDNATGNFTKIVQRLPVRIRVPASVANQGVLRPGMSVVVRVNTKQTALANGATPAQTVVTR